MPWTEREEVTPHLAQTTSRVPGHPRRSDEAVFGCDQMGRPPSPIVYLLVFAYVASVPFDIFQVAAGRTVQLPIALALVIAWVASKINRREAWRFPRAALIVIYTVVFWCLCTAFWSVAPQKTIVSVVSLALQLVVLIVLCDVIPNLFDRTLSWYALSASVLAVVVLFEPADAAVRGGRASVDGVDENITALVLAVGFAVALHLVFRRQGRMTWWWLSLAGVIAAGTVHTGSRTGTVALLFTLAVQAFVALPDISRRATAAIRLAVVAIAGSMYFFVITKWGGGPAERILSLFDTQRPLDDSGRSYIIGLYMRWMDDWFFTGVGYGADAEFLDMRSSEYLHAHSLLWKTWVETGVVGLLLFGALLTIAVSTAVRSSWRLTIAVLTAPLVPFAVSLGGLQVSAFWLVMAWALSAPQRPDSHIRSKRGLPSRYASARITGTP